MRLVLWLYAEVLTVDCLGGGMLGHWRGEGAAEREIGGHFAVMLQRGSLG